MRRAIARGRVFPQSYSTDRRYGRLSLKACALFPLMWVNADDQGRLCGDPDEVKYACCPNIEHITKADVPELLKELEQKNLIKVYETPKSPAIQMLDWWQVHRPQWAWPSEYPAPEGWKDRLRYKRGAKEVVTENWTQEPSERAIDGKAVYLAIDEEGKAIKIGIADSPEARVAELQMATPHKLRLAKVVEGGGHKLEHELHQRFAACSLGNEWFKLTHEIQSYLSGENSPDGSPDGSPEQRGRGAERKGTEKRVETERRKRKMKEEEEEGNSPEFSGENPPSPSPENINLFSSFFKAFGRSPDSRESAQLRDLEKEILSSVGGATPAQIHDAFKEAAKQNKLHVSYVRAVLLDWLGVERIRAP